MDSAFARRDESNNIPPQPSLEGEGCKRKWIRAPANRPKQPALPPRNHNPHRLAMMRMPIPDLRCVAVDAACAERAGVRGIEPVAKARRCAAAVPCGGELAVAVGFIVRLRRIERIARGEAAGKRAYQEPRMSGAR